MKTNAGTRIFSALKGASLRALSLALLLPFATPFAAGQELDFTHYSCTNFFVKFLSKEKTPELVEIRFQGVDLSRLFSTKLDPPSDQGRPLKGAWRTFTARWTRRQLTKKVISQGELSSGDDLLAMLEPGRRYTFAIQEGLFSFAPTATKEANNTLNIMSKHLALADGQPVLFSGEMWVKDGVLHFDNGSGTFRPGVDRIAPGQTFFQEVLGIRKAEGQVFVP